MKIYLMPPAEWRQRFGATVAGLFLLLLPLLMSAQQRGITVRGTVTNQQGEGLPGAAVGVRGSSEGVATKEDGSFSISVPQNSVLRISYVGFVTQEVTIGASAPENSASPWLPTKAT